MGYFVNNRSIISKFSLMKEEVLYIDKSDVIEKVAVLKKSLIQRYFCISRPRRFGKTTILQMLSAYYCKKSSALKEDFKYVDDDFKQYNVININMVGISYLKSDKDHKCKILEYGNSVKDSLFDKSNLF